MIKIDLILILFCQLFYLVIHKCIIFLYFFGLFLIGLVNVMQAYYFCLVKKQPDGKQNINYGRNGSKWTDARNFILGWMCGFV